MPTAEVTLAPHRPPCCPDRLGGSVVSGSCIIALSQDAIGGGKAIGDVFAFALVGCHSSRTTRTARGLASPRLRSCGLLHLLATARGSLLVGGDRLGHPARDALVTGLRFNHGQPSTMTFKKAGTQRLSFVLLPALLGLIGFTPKQLLCRGQTWSSRVACNAKLPAVFGYSRESPDKSCRPSGAGGVRNRRAPEPPPHSHTTASDTPRTRRREHPAGDVRGRGVTSAKSHRNGRMARG